MSTIMVKGQEVQVGDDLWAGGKPYRITRIEPYMHPVVTRNEQWWQACSDGPEGIGKAAWGITLEFAHGWEPGHYEVSKRPGDVRGDPHLSADDYLSPWFGQGAQLYPHYLAEGSPLPWREWLAGKPDTAAVLAAELDRSCPGFRYVNGAGDRFAWNWETGRWERP